MFEAVAGQYVVRIELGVLLWLAARADDALFVRFLWSILLLQRIERGPAVAIAWQ